MTRKLGVENGQPIVPDLYTHLLDECPECGALIREDYLGILRCHCGYNSSKQTNIEVET